MIRRTSAAITLVAMVVLLFAGTAFAHIAILTVDDTAEVSDTGGGVRVTGEIKCTAGEQFALVIALTQGDTTARGAIGFQVCAGGTGTGTLDWIVRAQVVDDGPLEPGPAEVCVTARTRPPGGSVDDTETTCQEVTLIPIGT
jgi:hypothetical protein